MAAAGCVTFRSTVRGGLEVPVKGTFIHFDIPLPGLQALQRASSCPPPLFFGLADSVAGELCHAMAPRRPCNAGTSPSQSDSDIGPVQPRAPILSSSPATKAHTQVGLEVREASPDGGISEASTKESTGQLETQSPKETLQKWVKKHGVNRSEAQVPQEPRAQRETRDLRDHRDQHVLVPAVAQQPQWESKHYGGKGGRDTALARRPTGGKAQSPKETLPKFLWAKYDGVKRPIGGWAQSSDPAHWWLDLDEKKKSETAYWR
jgi:hypothetical protein